MDPEVENRIEILENDLSDAKEVLFHHQHKGYDKSTVIDNETKYILIRIVDSATNCAVGTTLGGDLECPISGTITGIGAYSDTAGTTGTMTIDVNKGGTTMMTSKKITLDSTEKTSRTAATPPVLTTTQILTGDIITVDVDAIQTTPAKGLTIRIEILQV